MNRRAPSNLRSNDSGDIIVKRMTIPSQQITSTAAGAIGLLEITAALVQSNPASEWASFSARYQQYRVRSVKLVAAPRYPAATPSNGHSQLYVSDYIGTAAPSSAAQVLSDERAKAFSTSRPFEYMVTWSRNPNAKLWNPTSAALPAANSYAIALISSANASLPVSTVLMDVYYEYEVELRGSQ